MGKGATMVVILGVVSSVIAYFVIQKLNSGSSEVDFGINAGTKSGSK